MDSPRENPDGYYIDACHNRISLSKMFDVLGIQTLNKTVGDAFCDRAREVRSGRAVT